MSWFLMLVGSMLMFYIESGVFSYNWKQILLGISFALINIAKLIQDHIYKN